MGTTIVCARSSLNVHRLTNFRTIIKIARECESIMPGYHTGVSVLNATVGPKISYHV